METGVNQSATADVHFMLLKLEGWKQILSHSLKDIIKQSIKSCIFYFILSLHSDIILCYSFIFLLFNLPSVKGILQSSPF